MNDKAGLRHQRSNDFSPIANAYDRSRALPEAIVRGTYQRLVENDVIRPGSRVLDAGCGTGHFTIPFFDLGADIVGLDLSAAMVAVAQAKGRDLPLVVGSVYDLPFADGSFSVTLASKLFQHLEDWRRAIDEIFRVTSNGGSLVLLQDRGRFRNDVRRRFEQLADAAGVERYLGASDIEVVATYLASLGSSRRTLPSDDLTWTETVRYGDALRISRGDSSPSSGPFRTPSTARWSRTSAPGSTRCPLALTRFRPCTPR